MKQPKTESKRPLKKRETLKEKVRRHLRDKDHVITDEDIRDAVVGEQEIREQQADADALAKDIREEEKVKKTTPWDILDEDH